MKKIFLITAALWLVGCSTPPDTGRSCDNSGTYVESWQETWGDLTYNLPWCWIAASSTDQQLVLQSLDSEQSVEFSTFQLEIVEGPIVEVIKTSPIGDLLYLYVTNPNDLDVQRILDSIDWTTLATADIPPTSYNDYFFDLPVTWEKQEVVPVEGARAYAHLVASDGATYVNLYASSYYADFGSTRPEESLDGYFYDYMIFTSDPETLMYSGSQGVLVATNQLSDPAVQSLINSMILRPHEW